MPGGVSVAVDGFGIGYSALQRLVELPIATLKIDRLFVAEIPANDRAATVDRLARLGVDQAQGYYFAEPLAPEELVKWLDRWPRIGPRERPCRTRRA